MPALIRFASSLFAVGCGVTFAFAAAAPVACSKDEPAAAFSQSLEFDAGGSKFDPNNLVETAAFLDVTALDSNQVQVFLTKSPYVKASFLTTYQSNGLRAADAIVRAARKYSINPIVFLVRAQTDQGLVAERYYPRDPSRVEYAFGCGCSAKGKCDAKFAGFDIQLDCLGRAMRQSLDEIAAKKATSGGWGPGRAALTLDGETVTPANEATAALYQYLPRVGVRSTTGNWLFWNIWTKYANHLDYSGPIGQSGPTTWIGDPCKSDPNCGFDTGFCAPEYPSGGMCTAPCTDACPENPAKVRAFCANFTTEGYCLPICNVDVPGSCRDGYECKRVQKFGSALESEAVCAPKVKG